MKISNNFKILCISAIALVLPNCISIPIKNIEYCSVSGTIAAGADCVNSLNSNVRTLTLKEMIDYLEAQPEVKDENGKVIQKERGAAIFMSSQAFIDLLTPIEQACIALKDRCVYEVQHAVESTKQSFVNLQNKASKSKTNIKSQ